MLPPTPCSPTQPTATGRDPRARGPAATAATLGELQQRPASASWRAEEVPALLTQTLLGGSERFAPPGTPEDSFVQDCHGFAPFDLPHRVRDLSLLGRCAARRDFGWVEHPALPPAFLAEHRLEQRYVYQTPASTLGSALAPPLAQVAYGPQTSAVRQALRALSLERASTFAPLAPPEVQSTLQELNMTCIVVQDEGHFVQEWPPLPVAQPQRRWLLSWPPPPEDLPRDLAPPAATSAAGSDRPAPSFAAALLPWPQ